MKVRTRGAALAAAGLGALALLGPQAGAADAGTRAPSATTVPTVVAHMGSQIRLSDTTVHAGRILFKAVTNDRTHELQIARLRPGYTVEQANADGNKAFAGDVQAIARLDDGVSFRGGVLTHPQHPGWFSTVLKAGHYVVLDQNGPGLTMLTVTGQHPRRVPAPHQGTITAYSYGFGTSAGALPADGWIRIYNQADQPHFVEISRVKAGTTAQMVRKSFASESQQRPSFSLRAHAGAAVISPGVSEVVRVHLPAGRYLIMCFWPDRFTGMPHALMGMWKLVTLR